jgi:zinc protease
MDSMRRSTLRLLFCLFLLHAAPGLAAGTTAVEPPAKGGPEEERLIRKYVLNNGLTVVVRENRAVPVVAVQAWVKAGSATEPAERAGMSHILEHMAFKGTKRRAPGQIAREVEALGGEINAYTSFDQTVYHITISGRFLENALDILADTLGNSVFDSGELDREREVILEELRMNEDDPSRASSKALFRGAFKVHPYGRPVIGYADTIRKTSREDLLAYFARYYGPENMVLVMAGNVDTDATRPLVEKTFGVIPRKGGTEPERPAEPPQGGMRVEVEEREAERLYLDLGFHGPGMRDADVFAFDLLSSIMGGGETSRLYHEVKDRAGLVDSVSAYSYTPRDPGLLLIGATLESAKAKEALRAILLQVWRMTVAPPEGNELARAKAGTESDFLYSLESQSSLARHLGFFETSLGDAAFEEKYIQKIRAVTAEDLLTLARNYLRPENLTVTAVAPRGEGGALAEGEIRKIASEVWEQVAKERAGASQRRGVQVKGETLPNGVRVIVRENHAVPVVSVEAAFLSGLRGEEPGEGGVSVFAGELLTKGTKGHTAREISLAVEDMAADLAGFSGRNSIGLRGKFMRKDFDRGFALFREALLSPTYPPEEVEKKRKEVFGRLKLQKDEMTQMVFLLFLKTHYGDHPYSRNALGTEETVRAITPDSVRGYYERYLDPRNLVITVSGDVTVEEGMKAVSDAFGALPQKPSYAPPKVYPVPKPEGIRKGEERRDKEQAHFVIGYPGARFTDPDRYVLEVLGSALAGQGGRLFTNLRDKKSLAYSVTSFSSEQVDPGFFAFYMGTSADKADGAIADTLKEIEEVRKDGITKEELDRAKKWMVGSYEIGLQSNGAHGDRMLFNELYGVGYEETYRVPERIEAVTLEEVNAMARKILSTESYTLAVIRGK